jgi:hypothetical protein
MYQGMSRIISVIPGMIPIIVMCTTFSRIIWGLSSMKIWISKLLYLRIDSSVCNITLLSWKIIIIVSKSMMTKINVFCVPKNSIPFPLEPSHMNWILWRVIFPKSMSLDL